MKDSLMKKLRCLSGFTQAEISKFTKIHPSTLSRLEKGVVSPSIDQKKILADFFSVDEEILFPKVEGI